MSSARADQAATTDVVAIILAAGAGRRFGGPKALAVLDGERLVDVAVRTARGGGCQDVLVVAGAAPILDVDARVVSNVDWPTGLASSVRAGLGAAAHGPWTAALLLLVDTPWVGPQAVRRLLAAHQRGAVAAQAHYPQGPGHPVLLGRQVWREVSDAVAGDQGARHWLAAHPDLVAVVDCAGTGRPDDVDHPEDLRHG